MLIGEGRSLEMGSYFENLTFGGAISREWRLSGSARSLDHLRYRLTDKIPVIFHNLRGYDSHFKMQTIGEDNKHTYKYKEGKEKQMDINVIPNNMKNTWLSFYRQFSVHEFKP